MIPRGSTAFCLHDTHSLSGDSSDNDKMLKDWITNDGNLIIRPSNHSSLRTWMKNKARRNCNRSKETRIVNFVIYVVSGLEFLKYMDNEAGEGTTYAQILGTTFNCPCHLAARIEELSSGDDEQVEEIIGEDTSHSREFLLGRMSHIKKMKESAECSTTKSMSSRTLLGLIVLVQVIR